MDALFEELPQALEASIDIASRCRLELPLGTPKFPQVPLPPGLTAIQVLRQKAEAGALPPVRRRSRPGSARASTTSWR